MKKPKRILEILEEDLLEDLDNVPIGNLVNWAQTVENQHKDSVCEDMYLEIYYDDHDHTTLRLVGLRPETEEEIQERLAYEKKIAEKNAKRKATIEAKKSNKDYKIYLELKKKFSKS
jgi:hypothetical protein